MRENSIFGSIRDYFRGVGHGIRTVFSSIRTSLPYLFNPQSRDQTKEVTEQYPDPVSSRTPDDLPPRTRGLLFNDIEKCTGCRECEVVCPVKCIHVETELAADPGKAWVAVFDIDIGKCVSCGLCVEVCQPGSLVHTRRYEAAVYEKSEFIAGFGRGHVTPEQRVKWAELRLQRSQEDSSLG